MPYKKLSLTKNSVFSLYSRAFFVHMPTSSLSVSFMICALSCLGRWEY